MSLTAVASNANAARSCVVFDYNRAPDHAAMRYSAYWRLRRAARRFA